MSWRNRHVPLAREDWKDNFEAHRPQARKQAVKEKGWRTLRKLAHRQGAREKSGLESYSTDRPSRPEAPRFIGSAKSPSTKTDRFTGEVRRRRLVNRHGRLTSDVDTAMRRNTDREPCRERSGQVPVRTENSTHVNHVDALTVRSVFLRMSMSTSSVVFRVDWIACA